MTAPDYAEPIVGWRAWHLITTRCGVRLHAVGRDAVWEPGSAHEAVCLRRRGWRERLRPSPPHRAPAWGCTCGIWATRTLPRALMALDVYGRAWRPLHRVIGTVALWGELVEHEDGWRAAHAYPTQLYVPARRLHGPAVDRLDVLVAELADYGVPISVLDAGSRAQIRRAVEACGADHRVARGASPR